MPGKAEGSRQSRSMVKIDRGPAGLQGLRVQLLQAVKVEGVQVGVDPGEAELLPFPLRIPNWWMRPSPQHVAAADDAGMAEFRAQVVVPQVGMGVKVDDMWTSG